MRRLLPLLVLPALLLAACGDEPRTPPDSGGAAPALLPDPVPDVPEERVPEGSPPDLDAGREAQEQWHADVDRYGRGLLDSFHRRVLEPARDVALLRAKGVAEGRVGTAVARIAFDYDASRPLDDAVHVEALDDVAQLPKGALEQVRKFVHVSLAGPYRHVVHYLPPIQLLVTQSRDRKHRVVTSPPHHVDVSVSYSVDAQDLVAIRGTSVIPSAEITHFEWRLWHGRYLLEREWVFGSGADIRYEYDDSADGVPLLSRATVRKGAGVFDVSFSYDPLERGPAPSTPPSGGR